MVVRPFFVCAKKGRQKSTEKDKLKRLPHGIPASRGHVVAFHRASRQALPFIRPATPLLFQKICLKSFYFKHKMTGSLLLCGSLLSKGEEKSPFEGGKRRSRKGDV